MPEVKLTIQIDENGKAKLVDIADGAKKAGEQANWAQDQFKKFGESLLSGAGIGAGFEIGEKAAEGFLEVIKSVPEAYAAVGEAIVGSIEKAAAYGAQMSRLSSTTQVAVQDLQAYKLAATETGTPIESVAKAIEKLEKNVVAGSGSFRQLGLDTKALKNEAPAQMFEDVAAKILSIENPAERVAAKIALFGKAGADMPDTLLKNLAEAREKTEALGLALSDEGVKAATEFHHATIELGEAWSAVALQFGSAAIEGIGTDAINQITEDISKLTHFVIDHKEDISDFFHHAANAVTAMVTAVELAVSGLEKVARFAKDHPYIMGAINGATGFALDPNLAAGYALTGDPGDAPQSPWAGNRDQGQVGPPVSSGTHFGAPDEKAEADYQRRLVAEQKAYSDALAATNVGLDAQIQRFQAAAVAKISNIEKDKVLTDDQKSELEGLIQATAAQQEADAMLTAGRKNAVEFKKLGIETENLMAQAVSYGADALDKQLASIDAKAKSERDAADAVVDLAIKEGRMTFAILDGADAKKHAADASRDAAAADAEWKDHLDQLRGAHEALDQAAHGFFTSYFAQLEKIVQATRTMGETIGVVGNILSSVGLGGLGTFAHGVEGLASASAKFQQMQVEAAKHPDVNGGELTGAQNLLGKLGMAQAAIGIGVEVFDAIKGALTKPEFEKVMEDVGKQWGTNITEATAKAIESTESKDHVGRSMAELLNIDKIMSDSGMDPSKFSSKIGDLMNAVKLNAVNAKEGIAELGKAFTDLKTAADGGSVVSEAAMVKMIQRSRELGESIPELESYAKGLMDDAGKQLQTVFDSQLVEIATKTLPSYFTPGGAVLDPNLGRFVLGQVEHKGETVVTDRKTAGGDEQGQANNALFDAVWQGSMGKMGIVAATEAMQPALKAMMDSHPDTALTGSAADAAQMSKLLEDAGFKASATGAQAAGALQKDLLDSGNLSQKSLGALETTSKTFYNQALDGAKKQMDLQGAQKAAEEAILPQLVQMQHAEAMGMKLSPDMQGMLSQANKDGLLPALDPLSKQVVLQTQIRDGIFKLSGMAVPADGLPAATGPGGSSSGPGGSGPTFPGGIDPRTIDYRSRAIHAASGFSGTVNGWTPFVAGEAGPEHVQITPLGGGGGAVGGDGVLQEIRGLRSDIRQLINIARRQNTPEDMTRASRAGQILS